LLLALVVSLSLGLRLFAMARRTGRLPELLFGIAITAGATGSAGGQIGQRVLWSEASVFATILNAAGFGLILVGTCRLYGVAWQVFRPDRTWAAALAIAGSGMALLGYAIRALTGGFSTLAVESPGMAIFQGSLIVGFGWCALEAFRYCALVRRRVRVGLVDPLSAVQTLLWGISGLAMMLFGPCRDRHLCAACAPARAVLGRAAHDTGSPHGSGGHVVRVLPPCRPAAHVHLVGDARERGPLTHTGA
jgi:hypothetical protein